MKVLVTGASTGIGRAIAKAFAARGADLVLVARRRELLDDLARDIGPRARAVDLDVTLRRDVDEKLGPLEVDVLVNNAGAAIGMGKAHEADADDWEKMIDVNCKGLAWVTRAVLPGMVRRNKGHVVNMGSVAGAFSYPGGNVYGATKAFVQRFSENLRADLFGTRVRVTDVEPGMVGGTEFSLVRFKGDEERAKKTYEGMEALTPEDIAECVVFCASLPERVNVNRLEVMSVMQSFAGFAVHRS